MLKNRVKAIMSEGGIALGSSCSQMGSAAMVEIIGRAGFDACFIDMEHTAVELREVQMMVLAAERVGITPIVRTPGFDPAFILRLLDMGVQGIQVPHVSGVEGARAAVQAVRYPPVGDRGMFAGSRAADYGQVPLADHLEQSNKEIILAVMIEDLPALEEIDAIAATEGVDLIAVGPSDLSRALGVPGTKDHPKLVDAINRIAEAVRKSGTTKMALPMGHAQYPRTIDELMAMGVVGYSNCGPAPEVRLLRSLTEQATGIRAAMHKG